MLAEGFSLFRISHYHDHAAFKPAFINGAESILGQILPGQLEEHQLLLRGKGV